MTSNSFQFAFWILFNYVYSLNKPETINEIEKNLTSLGENCVFCTILTVLKGSIPAFKGLNKEIKEKMHV